MRNYEEIMIENHFLPIARDHLLDYIELRVGDLKHSPELVEEWKEDYTELHHEVFNTVELIDNRTDAIHFLGDLAFPAIEYVNEWELENCGEISIKYSYPKQLANLLMYILGEIVVQEFVEQLGETA